MAWKCSGIDAMTGAPAELEGGGRIDAAGESTAKRRYLAPGFIDIQVNGFAGVDYCNPAAPQEEIERSLAAQFATGVTRLLPTVITGGREEMTNALKNLARARRELKHGRAMAGFHVEGPHISPHDGPRGAHPARQVRPPDVEEYKRWQEAAEGGVRLVTVSPEWPGTAGYIEALVRDGVVAAIGHLAATREQIEDAVSAGATLSTHLGNGAHSQLPRHPNYLWQQMAEDRLSASFIVDGIHVDSSFLTVALRAKGVKRAILITDAVMPAGCAPGEYMLGEVEVELKPDHRVVLRGGDRLAGSSLMMHRGVGNLVRLGGISLADAVAMATLNPARLLNLEGRCHGLAKGELADIVEFDYDPATHAVAVRRTLLGGEVVYTA